LARAIGTVQSVFDIRDRDAELGGAPAIDVDTQLGVVELHVGRDVFQDRRLAELSGKLGGLFVERGGVGA